MDLIRTIEDDEEVKYESEDDDVLEHALNNLPEKYDIVVSTRKGDPSILSITCNSKTRQWIS